MLAKIYQASFVATFALHYAFVLLLVGIPLLAIVQRLRGRLDGAAWVFLRGPYPILISLTITTGVAPLLFSQVAFHRLFYLSFIALHPLPLIGLGLLILFFYLAYAITHWERVALPLAFVQVGLLVVFMIFFGTLFQAISLPERLPGLIWAQQWPPWLWHSLAAHLVLAPVAAILFFRLARCGWTWRALPVLGLAAALAVARELFRQHLLGDAYPPARLPRLDPSVWVFLLAAGVMIWVIRYAIRLAFAPPIAERLPGPLANAVTPKPAKPGRSGQV
jgi:hypothetical protein